MNFEAGQMLHGNPVGAPAPRILHAIMGEIRSEIARVFWNVNQKSWGFDPNASDSWYWNTPNLPENGTGIPGIAWRAYYNWGGSPDDADWNNEAAALPNFSFEGVEVRWYKRFGRSMNCNVVWSANKWDAWFQRCIQTLRAWEDEAHVKRTGYTLGSGEPTKYPDPAGALALEPDDTDRRVIELQRTIDTLEAQKNCIAVVCIDVARGEKPKFDKSDWRWCSELDWVTRLGLHALKAPGKLELHDEEDGEDEEVDLQ